MIEQRKSITQGEKDRNKFYEYFVEVEKKTFINKTTTHQDLGKKLIKSCVGNKELTKAISDYHRNKISSNDYLNKIAIFQKTLGPLLEQSDLEFFVHNKDELSSLLNYKPGDKKTENYQWEKIVINNFEATLLQYQFHTNFVPQVIQQFESFLKKPHIRYLKKSYQLQLAYHKMEYYSLIKDEENIKKHLNESLSLEEKVYSKDILSFMYIQTSFYVGIMKGKHALGELTTQDVYILCKDRLFRGDTDLKKLRKYFIQDSRRAAKDLVLFLCEYYNTIKEQKVDKHSQSMYQFISFLITGVGTTKEIDEYAEITEFLYQYLKENVYKSGDNFFDFKFTYSSLEHSLRQYDRKDKYIYRPENEEKKLVDQSCLQAIEILSPLLNTTDQNQQCNNVIDSIYMRKFLFLHEKYNGRNDDTQISYYTNQSKAIELKDKNNFIQLTHNFQYGRNYFNSTLEKFKDGMIGKLNALESEYEILTLNFHEESKKIDEFIKGSNDLNVIEQKIIHFQTMLNISLDTLVGKIERTMNYDKLRIFSHLKNGKTLQIGCDENDTKQVHSIFEHLKQYALTKNIIQSHSALINKHSDQKLKEIFETYVKSVNKEKAFTSFRPEIYLYAPESGTNKINNNQEVIYFSTSPHEKKFEIPKYLSPLLEKAVWIKEEIMLLQKKIENIEVIENLSNELGINTLPQDEQLLFKRVAKGNDLGWGALCNIIKRESKDALDNQYNVHQYIHHFSHENKKNEFLPNLNHKKLERASYFYEFFLQHIKNDTNKKTVAKEFIAQIEELDFYVLLNEVKELISLSGQFHSNDENQSRSLFDKTWFMNESLETEFFNTFQLLLSLNSLGISQTTTNKLIGILTEKGVLNNKVTAHFKAFPIQNYKLNKQRSYQKLISQKEFENSFDGIDGVVKEIEKIRTIITQMEIGLNYITKKGIMTSSGARFRIWNQLHLGNARKATNEAVGASSFRGEKRHIKSFGDIKEEEEMKSIETLLSKIQTFFEELVDTKTLKETNKELGLLIKEIAAGVSNKNTTMKDYEIITESIYSFIKKKKLVTLLQGTKFNEIYEEFQQKRENQRSFVIDESEDHVLIPEKITEEKAYYQKIKNVPRQIILHSEAERCRLTGEIASNELGIPSLPNPNLNNPDKTKQERYQNMDYGEITDDIIQQLMVAIVDMSGQPGVSVMAQKFQEILYPSSSYPTYNITHTSNIVHHFSIYERIAYSNRIACEDNFIRRFIGFENKPELALPFEYREKAYQICTKVFEEKEFEAPLFTLLSDDSYINGKIFLPHAEAILKGSLALLPTRIAIKLITTILLSTKEQNTQIFQYFRELFFFMFGKKVRKLYRKLKIALPKKSTKKRDKKVYL